MVSKKEKTKKKTKEGVAKPRRKRTVRVVLDTSIFVNPETRNMFGETPREALERFMELTKNIDWLEIYMAPTAWDELEYFTREVPPLAEIRIIRKSPTTGKMSVPASLVYDFVEEMRTRINKGLRIVEKGVKTEYTEENIRKFRNEYREALRYGIIDSVADLDTLLLAKEIDGIIITMDSGLIKWAKKLGAAYMNARRLKEILLLMEEL